MGWSCQSVPEQEISTLSINFEIDSAQRIISDDFGEPLTFLSATVMSEFLISTFAVQAHGPQKMNLKVKLAANIHGPQEMKQYVFSSANIRPIFPLVLKFTEHIHAPERTNTLQALLSPPFRPKCYHCTEDVSYSTNRQIGIYILAPMGLSFLECHP